MRLTNLVVSCISETQTLRSSLGAFKATAEAYQADDEYCRVALATTPFSVSRKQTHLLPLPLFLFQLLLTLPYPSYPTLVRLSKSLVLIFCHSLSCRCNFADASFITKALNETRHRDRVVQGSNFVRCGTEPSASGTSNPL